MRRLATVIGFVTWFVGQYFATLALGFLVVGRERLTAGRLFCLFIIHSIFWGVMQVGILKADLDKIRATGSHTCYENHREW